MLQNKRINPIALLGAFVGLVALVSVPGLRPGWLLFKANRLVAGEAYAPFGLSSSWTLALAGVWGLVALVGLLIPKARAWLLSLLAASALSIALLFIGAATNDLLVAARSSARVSLQGGVWLSVLAYYITLFAALYEAKGSTRKVLMVAPGLVIAAGLIFGGYLDGLGIAQELSNQGGDFRAEIVRHLALVGTSVSLAVIIGIPAAIWSARRSEAASFILPAVSLLQTLPSLALFGLMLSPLAQLGRALTLQRALVFVAIGLVPALLIGLWLRSRKQLKTPGWTLPVISLTAFLPLALITVILAVILNDVFAALFSFNFDDLNLGRGLGASLQSWGVRGIGTAPALIALTLYALLPIVRNTYTGIKEVPVAAIEAGRGMGMSPAQILRRVELPLAFALINEGLRASLVLSIGIATVAYLIGAGGLGTFIQRGIDQVVPDLILLGAIPVILLALALDGLLRLIGHYLTPRGVRQGA